MAKKKTIYWFHSHFLYWMGGTKYVYEVVRRLSREYKLVVIVENASEYSRGIYKDKNIDLISLDKVTSISFV